MRKITAVSLFTGAGGMDIGFENACISVLCANELNKDACDTYATNHPEVNLIRGDLTEHMDELKKYQGVDLVFGGPPCQGFSIAGKMDPNDERSQLIWRFLDVVELLYPKAFVMENVKALAVLEKWESVRQQYMKRVSDLGYSCGYWVLNASDYGIPQSRERVFFVGALGSFDFTIFEESLNNKKCKAPTLRELFQTLPEIGSAGNPHTCTARITLAGSPVMRKSPYAGMIFNGMGRPLNLDGISATLPASMGGNKTPIIDEEMLRNPSAEDWVKEYHGKLWRKEIEAEFGPAPERLRRISIVESAAIQTFPQDYKFCGSKSAIYTQIGNAVPCQLAQAVATAVSEVIFDKEAYTMKLNVDNVKDTVYGAYEKASRGDVPQDCSCKGLVDYVLDNTHLTYKYILVTALASKATDESINPLCLQVKSELPGAYDARSICHGVIVRFDMEVLNKALGGSNEPFLNKPARFPELSTTNAVRKGRDQSILNKLCSDLPLVDTAEKAFDGLTYAMYKLLLIKAEKEKVAQFTIDTGDGASAQLLSCINMLLEENHEGEVLTLVVAGLFDQYLAQEVDFKVEVHPVNQAGASSKEISDLDIYLAGTHYVANELKDKPFTDTDMIHAADKVMQTGKMHMNFIVGRHGGADPRIITECVNSYLERGFVLNVVPVDMFVPTLLGVCREVDCDRFAKYILDVAMQTKFKKVTIEYVLNVLKEHFDI